VVIAAATSLAANAAQESLRRSDSLEQWVKEEEEVRVPSSERVRIKDEGRFMDEEEEEGEKEEEEKEGGGPLAPPSKPSHARVKRGDRGEGGELNHDNTRESASEPAAIIAPSPPTHYHAPPPPANDSYADIKRSKQVLKHQTQKAALTAAAEAAAAEAHAAIVAAAYLLARVMKVRHGKSADMQLHTMRGASAHIFQRLAEAAINSSYVAPAVCSHITMLHGGAAQLQMYLASIWLESRLRRIVPRIMYAEAIDAVVALQRFARTRVYADEYDSVKGVCAAMYMTQCRGAFEGLRAAARVVQVICIYSFTCMLGESCAVEIA